uniref:Uncharacterized protein n=1 Tax=Oryza barthii TaxID=65489 RepID=A0A0D3HJ59_9ORYZ
MKPQLRWMQVSAGYGCQESSCARGNDEGCCAFGDDDEIREWRHGVQPRDLPCSGMPTLCYPTFSFTKEGP